MTLAELYCKSTLQCVSTLM